MSVTNLIRKTLEEIQNLMLTQNGCWRTCIRRRPYDYSGFESDVWIWSRWRGRKKSKQTEFGQGIGGGWSIEPVAFIIVGKDGAKMLSVGKGNCRRKIIRSCPKGDGNG